MCYLLDISRNERVDLKKEIKFIEDYISLEKIRLNKNCRISFEIAEIKENIYVAPMLFIPIVENVFKHGNLQNNDFVNYALIIQGNELFFEAINTIAKTDLIESNKTGTGLDNLKKRLNIIYPNRHLLEITHNEKLFKVTLQITL